MFIRKNGLNSIVEHESHLNPRRKKVFKAKRCMIYIQFGYLEQGLDQDDVLLLTFYLSHVRMNASQFVLCG